MATLPDLLTPPVLSPEEIAVVEAQSAILICVGVPAGTVIGLDYAEWRVGPRFVGVRLLPLGPHYLWFSAASKLGEFAPRSGFFFTAAIGDIIVTKWDPSTEALLQTSDVDAEYVDRITMAARRGEFHPNLALYPLKSAPIWQSLSKHCTPAVLRRVCCCSKSIVSTAGQLSSLPRSGGSGSQVDVSITSTISLDVATLSAQASEIDATTSVQFAFTPIPGCGHGSNPSDVTAFAMDTSSALSKVVTAVGNDVTQLCGELQLAFIGFMLGQQLQAFEHWKGLVLASCRCEDALLAVLNDDTTSVAHSNLTPRLFRDGFNALTAQLRVMPEDMLSDDLSKNHFLFQCFQSLHRTIIQCNPSSSNSVYTALSDLLCVARERFKWTPTTPKDMVSLTKVLCEGGPAMGAVQSLADGGNSYDGMCDDDADDDEDGPVIVDLKATML